MSEFILHHRLSNDCIELGSLQNSLLLLMNNSLVPWFILVPKTTKQELYELSEQDQLELTSNINRLSEFLVDNYKLDKLNVGSIGNVVNQMHIHVIGRRRDDYCWPHVVWGRTEKVEYKKEEINQVIEMLQAGLKDIFTCDHS